jgi:hypothetical protein
MDLVSWQIIHDDDVAWPQLGNERLFDIDEKGLAVHRAIEDHGRSDAVVTQPGSEAARPNPVTSPYSFARFGIQTMNAPNSFEV